MTDFPISNNNNFIGGLMKFYFINVKDILSEPEIFENRLIGDYTFKPGKQLLKGYFDRDSSKFDYEDVSGSKGKLFKNPFTAELSDNNPELDKHFCEMKCESFIVFIIDNYKNVRVLGRVDSGAKFTFSFSTKEKRKDSPVYSYKFYTETSCVIPITTTQITDIC